METEQLYTHKEGNLKAIMLYLFGFIFLPSILVLIIAGITTINESNEVLIGTIINFLIYLFLAISFVKLFYHFYKETLKKYLSNFLENVLISFGSWFALMVILSIISAILLAFGISDTSENQEAIENMIFNYWYLVVPFTCIFAPIVEETLFRKIIFDYLGEKSAILAITVSSLLFSSIHVMSELLSSTESIVVILPYVAMGVGLSLIYYFTKNIWFTIVTHSIQNTFAVIATLISFYQ